jgi:hypothetical protein
MNSFLFFQSKKGENDDKTGLRNGFWTNHRLQRVTDNTKQEDRSRLTNLSKNPIKENTINIWSKER